MAGTPRIKIEDIHVKLECANRSGSVKDRIADFMLREARRRGELRPGDTVVEATSGNTGIALARAGRELGHRVRIYMPEHMSAERRRLMEFWGAEVILTPREESFPGAIARRDRFRGRPGFYVPDQFGNPDNVRCHRVRTGRELVRQLQETDTRALDAFVAGVGTGGTLMGVGQALRERWPAVRLVAVEPAESAVMSGGAPGEHGIQGIGDGFIPDLVDLSAVTEVATVSTAEACATAREILERHGYCVGISSGANFAVARRLRDEGLIVATLWPDCSDRYVSLGLAPPSPRASRCPRAARCAARATGAAGAAF